MSELTSRLRRMLAQAEGFTTDAPMEALARAKLLVHEAHAALSLASDAERDEVLSILSMAKKRIVKYEQKLETFQGANHQRAALFDTSHGGEDFGTRAGRNRRVVNERIGLVRFDHERIAREQRWLDLHRLVARP